MACNITGVKALVRALVRRHQVHARLHVLHTVHSIVREGTECGANQANAA